MKLIVYFCAVKIEQMRNAFRIFILAISVMISACSGKYDDEPVDSADVLGYVSACTVFDSDFQDFLAYVDEHDCMSDSSEIRGYSDVMRVLNSQGFIDVDYFMHVHYKLKPVLEAIRSHPDVERFPGIGTADLSFLDEGEQQYRKFLEDNTLSSDDKAFFRAQMAQIETTKLDLFDKQEKNKIWVNIVRGDYEGKTDVELQDVDIMQLTILERDSQGF